jgi:hypothetical protein
MERWNGGISSALRRVECGGDALVGSGPNLCFRIPPIETIRAIELATYAVLGIIG